jgi:hypothetical protein
MVKTKIVSSGKLDMVGLKKIGKSLLITVAAAAIGWLGNSTGFIDYGSMETVVATFLPFVVNFLYKLLGEYESA